jgi:hypothetical protein
VPVGGRHRVVAAVHYGGILDVALRGAVPQDAGRVGRLHSAVSVDPVGARGHGRERGRGWKDDGRHHAWADDHRLNAPRRKGQRTWPTGG